MKIRITNKIETIFLDFDGTIKLSDNVKGKVFYEIFGKKILNSEKKKIFSHHKRNLGVSREKKIPIYMNFCNIKYNLFSKKFFLKKYSKMVTKKVIESKWVIGSKLFLKKNEQKNLILVTASPHKEIIGILKKTEIFKYFKEIYGYPYDKKIVIKNYIKKNKINVESCLYIGNSTSDYYAAKYNKMLYINIGKINGIKNLKFVKNFNFINT